MRVGATAVLRVLAVVGLVVAAGLGAVATASAHSQLERSDPGDGSTVAALPGRITLTFNQNVLGLGTVLEVKGPGGDIAAGKPTVVDNQVEQPVDAGAPAGAYTVLWRVTSADGHPISGTFGFTATTGAQPPATTGAPSPAATGAPSPAATAAPGRTVASGNASTAPVPAESSDRTGDEDTGSSTVLVWLLVAAAAVLVAGGTWLAARRTRGSHG